MRGGGNVRQSQLTVRNRGLLGHARRVGLALIGAAAACAPGAAVAAPCLPPPPAIRDVDVSGYYSDKTGSVIDQSRLKERDRIMEPMLAFLREVVKSADRAMRGDADAGRCAVAWLDAWAAGHAWLGILAGSQAEYERKWDLAGYALAYIKVKDYATAEQRARIEAWLIRLADASRKFFDDRRHKRNNHWYWLGLAVGATAIATGSERHWEMARGIMTDAARDITADGVFPLEIARGGRALHYHGFSVMPVVMLAELGASRGEDWYGLNGGAVHRLVDVFLRGFADPKVFERLSGVPQQPRAGSGSGWLQLYRLRFPGRLPATLPDAPRGHRWIGGDAALLKAALDRRPAPRP